MMFCGFELIIKSIITEFNPSLLVEKGDINDSKMDFYAINCRKAFMLIKNRFPELNLDLHDELFREMNNFRNGMLHKGMGNHAVPIDFWFHIVERVVNNLLKDSVINYFAEYDPDGVEYILEMMENNNLGADMKKCREIFEQGTYESLTINLNV